MAVAAVSVGIVDAVVVAAELVATAVAAVAWPWAGEAWPLHLSPTAVVAAGLVV